MAIMWKLEKNIRDTRHLVQWIIESIGNGLSRYRKRREISSRMTKNSKTDVRKKFKSVNRVGKKF